MLIRRFSTRLWGLRQPPLASSTLMLLLCLSWLMDMRENLALVPSLKLFQAYRVVTYCLCHMEATHLAFNLLLFPLLGWHQELHQGTLLYLHASLLSASTSALLYLLLARLGGAESGHAVGSYTPVHLAMLGHHQRLRGLSGCLPMTLLAGLLLGLNQLLCPQSPFLLNLCGLLICLAYQAGIFSPLELSERCLERLHSGIVCRSLARNTFFHFIMPTAPGLLPTFDPEVEKERIPSALELRRAQPLFARDIPTPPLSPASYWSGKRPGPVHESELLHTPPPPPPSLLQDPFGPLNVPFGDLQESLIDEELLKAGIHASLQDMSEGEVKLSKSSISSLRLQQLQKMGFPTEPAVVALAATGHVEGAVSLLIGGHVGDKAVVVAESRPPPLLGPHQ